MARTGIDGDQIRDGSVQRVDLCTDVAGKSVITKLIAGKGILLTETGADPGTGDVTVAAATQPVIRAIPATTQSISNGVNTRINYANAIINTVAGLWVTNRFTVAEGGIYSVFASLRMNNTAAGQLMLYKNGVVYSNLEYSATAIIMYKGSDLIELAVTDYIEIWLNVGANRTAQIADTRVLINQIVSL